LLNEESQYNLKNVKINDVKSNGKALLYFINNDITITNCEMENINCNGDINYSSLILYDSMESNKKISLNNVIIKNVNSNGPMIKIDGDLSEFSLENAKITENVSYGPIFENISKKVLLL